MASRADPFVFKSEDLSASSVSAKVKGDYVKNSAKKHKKNQRGPHPAKSRGRSKEKKREHSPVPPRPRLTPEQIIQIAAQIHAHNPHRIHASRGGSRTPVLHLSSSSPGSDTPLSADDTPRSHSPFRPPPPPPPAPKFSRRHEVEESEHARSQVRVVVPRTPQQVFSDNVRSVPVFVNTEDTEAVTRFKSLGISAWALTHVDHNLHPHPASAAFRKISTARAFEYAYSSGVRAMTSIYGSPRDADLIRDLNVRVDPPLTLRVHRPIITPADLAREVVDEDPLPRADGVLLVDVYKVEPEFDENERLTPQSLTNLMRLAGVEIGTVCGCLWVGHRFAGDAGTIDREGAWLRINGQIVMRPDDTGEAYPPHDPCDWLWDSDGCSVDYNGRNVYLCWHRRSTVGSFQIIQFSLRAEPLVLTALLPMSVKTFYRREISIYAPTHGFAQSMEDKGWYGVNRSAQFLFSSFTSSPFSYIASFLGYMKVSVLIHPDFETFCDSLPIRGATIINAHSYDDVIKSYVQRHDQLQLLMKLFPEHFVEYQLRLRAYFYTHVLPRRRAIYETSLSIARVPWQSITEESRRLTHSATSVAPTTPPWVWIGGAFLLGVFSIYSLKKLSPIFSFLGRTTSYLPGSLFRRTPYTPAGVFDKCCQEVVRVAPSISSSISKSFSSFLSSLVLDCLVAPIVEEFVKRYVPYGWVLPEVELAVRAFQHFEYGQNIFQRSLLAYGMHRAVALLPFGPACFFHSLFNCWVLNVSMAPAIYNGALSLAQAFPFNPDGALPGSLWSDFVFHYHHTDWEARRLVDLPAGNWSFSPREARVPTSPTSRCVIPPADPLFIVKDTMDTSVVKVPLSYTYMLLPTSMPIYQPAATTANLRTVVLARLLKENIVDPLTQYEAWKTVWIPDVSFPEIRSEDHVDDWILKMDSLKRIRYQRAKEDLEKCTFDSFYHKLRVTKIMVKTDEVLCRVSNGFMELKPRPIANIHPLVQVVLGPSVYETQHRLKEYWSIEADPVVIRGHNIHITFGCGCTDKDLSRWAERVLSPVLIDTWYILVAGDDSLVLHWKNKTLECFEGDASCFDQTQSFGALQRILLCLGRFGLSPWSQEQLLTLAHNTYMAYSKEGCGFISVNRKYRGMRDTGGVDTSVGNSVGMALAWVDCIVDGDIDENFKRLGFQMKMNKTTDFYQCTFLKGLWYHCLDGSTWWGPLPSRILKVGKALRDPRELYKGTFEQCCAYFLNDVAMGYSYFLQIPILRSFVKNFAKDEIRNERSLGWRAVLGDKGAKPQIDEEAAQMQLLKRYGTNWLNSEEIERGFPSDPFVFMSDPLFITLGLRDYN
jgi:hypothetical protein